MENHEPLVITHRDFAVDAHERTGVKRDVCRDILRLMLRGIVDGLARGRRVKLRGLGAFVPHVGPRTLIRGFHPVTGAEQWTPRGSVVRFRPAKALREALNLPD